MKPIFMKFIFSACFFFVLDYYCSNYFTFCYFFYFKMNEFTVIQSELDIFYFKETIRFYLGSFYRPVVFDGIFDPNHFLIRIQTCGDGVLSIDIIPRNFSILKKHQYFFYGSCSMHMYYFTDPKLLICLQNSFECLLHECRYFVGMNSYVLQNALNVHYPFVQCFNIRHYMWNIFCKYFLIFPQERSIVCFYVNWQHLMFFINTSMYKYCLRFVLHHMTVDFIFRKLFS